MITQKKSVRKLNGQGKCFLGLKIVVVVKETPTLAGQVDGKRNSEPKDKGPLQMLACFQLHK